MSSSIEDEEAHALRGRVEAVELAVEDLVADIRSTAVPLVLAELLVRFGQMIIEPARAILDEGVLDEDRQGLLALSAFTVGERERSVEVLLAQVRTLGPSAPISARRLAQAGVDGTRSAILDGLWASKTGDVDAATALVVALAVTGGGVPADLEARLRAFGSHALDQELNGLRR